MAASPSIDVDREPINDFQTGDGHRHRLISMVEKVDRHIDTFENQLKQLDPDVFKEYPPAFYLQDALRVRLFSPNSYFSPRLKRRMSLFQKQYGKAALALYHKLALSDLIAQSLASVNADNLPKGILSELIAWFDRMCRDFSRLPDDYYDFDNDNFKLDLSVCSRKSLPVGGAWIVQIRRIGLRSFLTADLFLILKLVAFLTVKTKGFSPFCVIHTFPRYVLKFNCDNMKLAYMRIGELLLAYDGIKGIYRRSWFLDPAIETVSPELAFLRAHPKLNGAVFFKAAATRADVNRALERSKKRRALYREGKYRPEAYAFIWPRNSFLDWHNKSFRA